LGSVIDDWFPTLDCSHDSGGFVPKAREQSLCQHTGFEATL
jgi:hypothetical protein